MSKTLEKQTRNSILFAINQIGSQTAVARAFNPRLRQQSVNSWLRFGFVPVERVIPLCKLADRRVKPHELNPYFFTKEVIDYILQEYGNVSTEAIFSKQAKTELDAEQDGLTEAA